MDVLYRLSEIRRECEDTIVLDSSHLLYFCEGDKLPKVNKNLARNVVKINSVLIVLKRTGRYSLKVVQVYTPRHTLTMKLTPCVRIFEKPYMVLSRPCTMFL
ncbi:unnamed protein product [Euphydryas editha]|uniref:Uncharacterized protein n=1 Tax=Euphydryas editha TaxID=104508 RepID=A0AAU9U3Y7_EUPED|nr:unnamed protein product [Euphydryas editha]